jgi:hypothetical protein
MNVRNFLTEKSLSTSNDLMRDIVFLIKRDCDHFLKEMKGSRRLLYRGISELPTQSKEIIDNVYKVLTRKNRKPADMPNEIHIVINKKFKEKFGWQPRTEGVFTSFDSDIAYKYGNSYYFFPIGKYKYIYSDVVHDLYEYFQDNYHKEFFYYFKKNAKEKILDVWNVAWRLEYEKSHGENTPKGVWFYKGKNTNEFNIDKVRKKLNLPYDENWRNFEWRPDISFDNWVDKEIIRKRIESEKEIDKSIKTYKTNGIGTASFSTEIVFKCDEYYIIYAGDDVDEKFLVKALF